MGWSLPSCSLTVVTSKNHTSIKIKQTASYKYLLSFYTIPGHGAQIGVDLGTVETGVNLRNWTNTLPSPKNIKWILARFSELLDSLYPHLWMILRVFLGLQITKNMDTKISFFPNKSILFFYIQIKSTKQNIKKIASGLNLGTLNQIVKCLDQNSPYLQLVAPPQKE